MCRMPLTFMYSSHTLLIHVLVYWRPTIKKRCSSLAEMEDCTVATPFKKYCSVVNTCQYTLKVQCADKRPSHIPERKGFDDSLLQTLASNVNAECRYKWLSYIPKWKGFNDSMLQTLASIQWMQNVQTTNDCPTSQKEMFQWQLVANTCQQCQCRMSNNKWLSHIPKWKGFNNNLLLTLTSIQSK